MSPDKPTYDELCDALVAATKSLRGEAEALQDSHMRPDGTYHTEAERDEVEEAFAEVDRLTAVLQRAGRSIDESPDESRTGC